jgi:hypothetical protein
MSVADAHTGLAQRPDIHSRPVVLYRWVVFLLAAGYSVYQLTTSDYGPTGGPFRFLTIWALLASFYAASRMLALSERRSTARHEVTAMVASVLNGMVVILYWRLYFQDPALVNQSGPVPWHQEYYLHVLGPALQLFDAVVIGRVYRRVWRAALVLVGVIAAYVAWAELFVARFNDFPIGSVTSGLPYPFLNSMVWDDRLGFYGFNGVAALGLLVGFAGLGAAVNRLWPPAR